MRKRITILEFSEEQLIDAGFDIEALYRNLGLSRSSSITLHADGRLILSISEDDLSKVDAVKGILGQPKSEKTVVIRKPEPPPPQPSTEITATSSEIECPFCRAKLRLKMEKAVQDGIAESSLT